MKNNNIKTSDVSLNKSEWRRPQVATIDIKKTLSGAASGDDGGGTTKTP